MNKIFENAKVIIESLPFIKTFSGKIFVIKYGGSAMSDTDLKKKTIEDIIMMKLVGIKPVIVHGGGPAINNMLNKFGKKSSFKEGLRVTDSETLLVTEMVLSGLVNKELVTYFQQNGIPSIGISGKDGMTITAKKRFPDTLGFVGDVAEIDTRLIYTLLENGYIPVISPVSCDKNGQTYNINADTAASEIAAALKAEKLIYLTDTPGVLGNQEDESTLFEKLTLSQIKKYIDQGVISGGMIPKMEEASRAVLGGVNSVHVLDGRIEHSILLEVFTQNKIGTMIKRD